MDIFSEHPSSIFRTHQTQPVIHTGFCPINSVSCLESKKVEEQILNKTTKQNKTLDKSSNQKIPPSKATHPLCSQHLSKPPYQNQVHIDSHIHNTMRGGAIKPWSQIHASTQGRKAHWYTYQSMHTQTEGQYFISLHMTSYQQDGTGPSINRSTKRV